MICFCSDAEFAFDFFSLRFSYTKGFVGLISEIYDIAGQHEVIAENLTTVILQGIQLYVQQVKQDRKKVGCHGYSTFGSLFSPLQMFHFRFGRFQGFSVF